MTCSSAITTKFHWTQSNRPSPCKRQNRSKTSKKWFWNVYKRSMKICRVIIKSSISKSSWLVWRRPRKRGTCTQICSWLWPIGCSSYFSRSLSIGCRSIRKSWMFLLRLRGTRRRRSVLERSSSQRLSGWLLRGWSRFKKKLGRFQKGM